MKTVSVTFHYVKHIKIDRSIVENFSQDEGDRLFGSPSSFLMIVFYMYGLSIIQRMI